MPKYTHKDATTLAYEANKKRLRVEGQILLDNMMNEAVHEMTQQFNKELSHGRIVELKLDEDSVRKLFKSSSRKVLGA
jgi:hypothetical protein